MSLVFLIGMPGAGKSHWGRQLALHSHVPYTDLDKFIVNQERASTNDLFSRNGEQWFREKEHQYLKKLIATSKPDTVIACGGGTPCFHDNMALMNKAGITVYLKTTPEKLLKNMRYTVEMRPLLKDREDVAGFLHNLLEQRAPFYEQAQYILQTEDISLVTFNEIIR